MRTPVKGLSHPLCLWVGGPHQLCEKWTMRQVTHCKTTIKFVTSARKNKYMRYKIHGKFVMLTKNSLFPRSPLKTTRKRELQQLIGLRILFLPVSQPTIFFVVQLYFKSLSYNFYCLLDLVEFEKDSLRSVSLSKARPSSSVPIETRTGSAAFSFIDF